MNMTIMGVDNNMINDHYGVGDSDSHNPNTGSINVNNITNNDKMSWMLMVIKL